MVRFVLFMVALFSLMVCTSSDGLLSFGCEDEDKVLFDDYEATEITTTSARLNATCIRCRVAGGAEVRFLYSTESHLGDEWEEEGMATEYQTVTARQEFSAVITGLNPGTRYLYLAVYSGVNMGDDRHDDTGAAGSFTTASLVETLDADYPAVSTMATLRGNLPDLLGASSVEVYFKWGAEPGVYLNETPHQTMTAPGTFFSLITGPFNIGSTYYFVARAGEAQGEEKSFTVV